MKKIFFLLLAMAALQLNAQTDARESTASLNFAEPGFNFGKIPQGKPVHHQFIVTNTTNKPIQINSVQATCGCTTPEWDHEAIPANGQSVINVGYNAASEGPFEKYINVTFNGGETFRLRIDGTVWKAPMNSAPQNESIVFLKKQLNN